jgi:Family of unknown function (DUF6448)
VRNQGYTASLLPLMLVLSVVLFVPAVALARCDGMDGPVVKAAQKAFETGNVNLALIWVQKKDEPEIRAAFQRAIAVRKLSREARELADVYFFETLVRIHRGGEGEPYAGLKPAGRDLGPAIPAADKAIDTGSLEPLLKLFPASAHVGIRERFDAATARKHYNKDDVEAGREYVKAYVEFIHYVEDLYGSAESAAHDRPQTGHDSLAGHLTAPLFDLSVDFNVTQTTVLTFYVSRARGGGVQGFVFPAGGNSPPRGSSTVS